MSEIEILEQYIKFELETTTSEAEILIYNKILSDIKKIKGVKDENNDN